MTYIKTKDIETKDLLIEVDFTLLSKDGNTFIFANDCSSTFMNKPIAQ